jgi:NAD(P)-dependent dehydrogenase (short-subunit alcohol dehydrogenase family)
MPARSVLITGASTGIGRACALRLDRDGWRVFAGIRKPSDAEDLASAASDRLMPVTIDVTDARTIEATADELLAELGEAGLQGLVNNAGISVQGPIEYLDPKEILRQFEVNVTCPDHVTPRAQLPRRVGRQHLCPHRTSAAAASQGCPSPAPLRFP